MSKILKVVDIENWVQYQKAKWVASEFKIPYQKLTEKLGGAKINDTRFVYGELIEINLNRSFLSKNLEKFEFLYKFYNKNKMQYSYIIEINGKKIEISKENGDFYINKLTEV